MTVVMLKVILLVFVVNKGICDDDEYAMGFHEGLSDCKNFDNKMMDGNSLQLGKPDEEGDEAMFLQGHIKVREAIKPGYLFDLEIEKETETGSEPMWSCTMDICKSLDDEDAPWSAAMESLGITKCPIEVGEYHCSNMTLNLSFLKDKMSPEFEGIYKIVMKITDDMLKELSCHNLGAAIKQKEKRK